VTIHLSHSADVIPHTVSLSTTFQIQEQTDFVIGGGRLRVGFFAKTACISLSVLIISVDVYV